jgi:hypothetical protein
MRSCYIAGPMRGYKHFNFPAFDEAEALGVSLGWHVLSPASTDRSLGFDETSDSLEGFDMEAAIDRDIAMIRSLRADDGDAIVMLPGWEKSKGARAEHALAVWMGLAILDARTFEPMEAAA